MSRLEEGSEGPTLEIVDSMITYGKGRSVILCLPNETDTQDPTKHLHKKFCLCAEVDSSPCMPVVVFPLPENYQSCESSITLATDVVDELTGRNLMEILTLQKGKPDETTPVYNKEDSVANQG